MNVPCPPTADLPTIDELIQQLERDCQGIIPTDTLTLLLVPLYELAAMAPTERDESLVETAVNRFEDVLEAFLLNEAALPS